MKFVPNTSLVVWAAVIIVPFATVAGILPGMWTVSLYAIAGLGIVATLDAVLSVSRLEGLAIELPTLVRLSKGRTAKVELKLRNPKQTRLQLRIGLPFPAEIRTLHEELSVALPASEWSRLSWECHPVRRGSYLLSRVYLETQSWLRMWLVRGTAPVHCELRVYPNLLQDRNQLSALFLNRSTLGLHAQRQVGKGREFEKLREYIPGDSSEDIHWKATAKRGHPVTKVFQIERTQEIYVLIDASRLSSRRPAPNNPAAVLEEDPGQLHEGHQEADDLLYAAADSVLERYITAALVLGLAAEHQGDHFGVLLFADKVERFIRARNGKGHYHTCRDALYAAQPRLVAPDFDEAAAYIRLQLRRRALIIILTALDDPVLAESFVRNMDLLARQHLVLVNMLKPPGADPLFTGPKVTAMDDMYERLGGHLQWHKLRELGKVLQRRGVKFSLLENEKLSAELVSQYLAVKQRQAL